MLALLDPGDDVIFSEPGDFRHAADLEEGSYRLLYRPALRRMDTGLVWTPDAVWVTYYPGVPELSQAQTIEVRAGQQITGLEFRLTTPVAGAGLKAEVWLYDLGYRLEEARVDRGMSDERGGFRLVGAEGRKCGVFAHWVDRQAHVYSDVVEGVLQLKGGVRLEMRNRVESDRECLVCRRFGTLW